MNRADLLVHFGFNQWANQRILAHLAKLSEEELKAPSQLNHGSAFDLLRHTLDCEWSWRLIGQGELATAYMWEVEDLSNLEAIARAWQSEHNQMLTYLQAVNDSDLEQPIDFGTSQGRPPKMATLWHLLMHILYHSHNHRSELATYLTAAGHSPGDLDFLDYIDPQ